MKENLSHYRVIRKLGAGGMGEVYLAEDIRLRRPVALKILSSDLTGEVDQMRRFEQEAHAASALNHPNIMTIYEVGIENGTRFIATEYVEGETLRQLLSRSQLTLREVLDIAIQIAGALAASHEAGIVHRDIKPENIMVRPDGYVKVLDFGIAKLTENFTSKALPTGESTGDPTLALVHTGSNVLLGSPSYMSPEQARGLVVDARTDLFSLGLILYEMLGNKRPFEGQTSFDVIAAIVNKEPVPLTELAPDIPDALNHIVMKALNKDREARYQSAVKMIHDLRALKYQVEHKLDRVPAPNRQAAYSTREISQTPLITVKELTPVASNVRTSVTGSISQQLYVKIKQHKWITATLTALAALALLVFLFYPRSSLTLNERDSVLLADFVNATGDPVFDGTLRQALAVQLEQSPFLSIFSDERIRETLRYMNRSQEERLTVPVAREICQRQGLKALLTGSISSLGSHYVISLEALNAYTGDAIARQQVEAESKEKVLTALGKATSGLREKLGESLRTIQKYDAAIEQATTSSLEALKAYSLGNEQQGRGKYLEAIPFYRRAIELDPEFALAYARLAVAYDNSRQTELAAEYATKAFEKRERVSEREKLFIAWRYYSVASRELDKAIEVLELWKQTFPRNPEPSNTLSFYYSQIGQYDKAISEAREAIQLSPNRTQPYSNLAIALMCLNRFDEAKAVYEQAMAQGLDSTGFHWGLYQSGFAQSDDTLMQQQINWLAGKSNEYEAVDWQAKTSAYAGQLNRGREFSNRAIELALRGNLKEVAAQFTAHAALRAAAVGNCQNATSEVTNALALANTNTTVIEGALVLALCGDSAQAMNIMNEQYKRYPKDTLLNMLWLPTVKAIIELRRNNAAAALQLLQAAQPYEAGYIAAYWPTYIRAQAYLKLQAGQQAATEFQKILDRKGINMNTNLYSLAHLGLARALALAGKPAESQKAYEEFFTIWKAADADIPILQEARSEYEKRQK